MRYLVTARVRLGQEEALLRAIEDGTLGRGSVAGVEICFCWEPLDEETPYWEESSL